MSATDVDGIVRLFTVDERHTDELPVRYNVAPTQQVYAVAASGGRRHLVAFRWGLVPRWSADTRGGARMINARAETVWDKPAFRESIRRRRCLVPADGWYEWQRRGSRRVPHFIGASDGTPLAFAAVWEGWRDPQETPGQTLRSTAILTASAPDPLSDLHDRMPVILPASSWDAWLDSGTGPAEVVAALEQRRTADLTCHPVGDAVNAVANDHPGLLEPSAET